MWVLIGARLPASNPADSLPTVAKPHEDQATVREYRHPMRPFTAIVVIGLLVIIVGAFVAKLVSTGLTP
jgi:hypothetical protein